MSVEQYVFTSNQINRYFPFHIIIDESTRIVSVGESLRKLVELSDGELFSEHFEITLPHIQLATKNDLEEILNIALIITVNCESKILFKGQFEKINSRDEYIFFGSPCVSSLDEVEGSGMLLTDYSINDPVVDLLEKLNAQELAIQDAHKMLHTIQNNENELKKSAQRLSAIISNLQNGILLEDENRHIILINKIFCDLFEIPVNPELLIGTDCSQSAEQSKLLFKDQEKFVLGIEKLLSDRKVVLNELLELSDGRFFSRDYIPIYVDDQYKGHLWKYSDITAEHAAEIRIRIREEKYHRIIANMNLGLLEVDLNEKILFANQSFSEMSGFSSRDLIGKSAPELFMKEEGQEMLRERNERRKKGDADAYEISVLNKRGEERWWLISGAPMMGASGEIVGSIGIHLDITDQKELEIDLLKARQLAEASAKAKESFLANMSHEIRTPLNAIIGMLREMSRNTNLPPKKATLSIADTASKHLLSIINNILDISKIEAGEMELEDVNFSLRSVIEDTTNILSVSAREKNLEFEVFISDNLKTAYLGDPGRIRQIMINLMGNSIKFTEKGRIKIDVNCNPVNEVLERIHITIQDTGIGIEKEFAQNLFSKFSQEDKSTARKYGGTGLGMAITYQLLQLMNGTISVESEKGFGTRIDIHLILDVGNPEKVQNLNVKEHGITLEKQLERLSDIKVLLVEDNQWNQLVAVNSLSLCNIKTTIVENGLEAVKILGIEDFDLVLMDLQMPGMDGLEATRVIRDELKLKVPIIGLTANAFKAELEKCKVAGMNDYVIKPFEESVLFETLIKNLGRQKVLNPSRKNPILQKPLDHQLYDLSKLERMSRGKKEFVDKMLLTFIETTEVSLMEIRQAVKNSNFITVARIAHRMRPGIDNIGVSSIKNEMLMIEQLALENPDSPELKSVFQKIEKVLTEVIIELKARLS